MRRGAAVLTASSFLLFGAAASEEERAWAPYTEIADFYQRFDAADPARRAGIDFQLRVVPSTEVSPSDLIFTIGEDVSFGAEGIGLLAFPRSRSLLADDPLIFVNQPTETLLWLVPTGYFEGADDGEATGEELRDFAKRFGKIVKSNAGAFSMFVPSPTGVRVRGLPGGSVTVEGERGTETLPSDEQGRLVLSRKRLKDVDRVRFDDGQTVEAYYEKAAFFLTDIDAANR